MAILDTFTLVYDADSSKATVEIDKLDKKSQDSVKKIQKSIKDAIEKANKELAEIHKNTQSQDDKNTSQFLNNIKKRIAGMKKLGEESVNQIKAGSKGAITTLAAGSKGAITTLAGASGMGGALNVAQMVSGFALATAAVSTFASAIAAATERAKEAAQYQKTAWGVGMSVRELVRAELMGQRLQLTKEQTREALGGFHERVQAVALERQIIRPGEQLSQETKAFSRYGTNVFQRGSKGQLRNYEDILWTIINRQRTAVQKGAITQERAIQRLMQIFGLNFEFASKSMQASNEEIKNLTKGLQAETLQKTAAIAESKKLALEQDQLTKKQQQFGDVVARQVTPALNGLYEEMNKSGKGVNSFAQAIGDFTSAVVDGVKNMISSARQFKEQFANKAEYQKINTDMFNKYRSEIAAGKLNPFGTDEQRAEWEAIIQKEMTDRSAKRGGLTQSEQAQKALVGAENLQALSGLAHEWTVGRGAGKLPEKSINDALQKAIKEGWTPSVLEEYLKEINEKAGKVAQGQADGNKDLKGILNAVTYSMSIEEGLALWAGAAAKGAGFKTQADFRAMTPTEWYQRQQKAAGMARAYGVSQQEALDRMIANQWGSARTQARGVGSMGAASEKMKAQIISNNNDRTMTVQTHMPVTINAQGVSAAEIGAELDRRSSEVNKNTVTGFSDNRLS